MSSLRSLLQIPGIYTSTTLDDDIHYERQFCADNGPETPPLEAVTSSWLDAIRSEIIPDSKVLFKPTVAVIGVGYVGLHLVQLFSEHYDVIAFDTSPQRLKTIAPQMLHPKSIIFTSKPWMLSRATHFLISVPTLIRIDKMIDTSYLRAAIGTVQEFARPGTTVVIESSVAVGMTRQLLGPLIKSHGIFAGMSPERVDPGRVEPQVNAIPKIISGLDDLAPGSLQSINELYSAVFSSIVKVSSPEVAEMTKLYENCQRMICIAYANEMADACFDHKIDPYEVSSAAATKPFGYMPYTPSLGIGGHCIPINPYYLLSNSKFPLLEAATIKMSQRPAQIGQRVMSQLTNTTEFQQRKTRKVKALVVGVGFKRGQSTLSNSPGIALINFLLSEWDAHVTFADPLVSQDSLTYVPKLEAEEWTQEDLEEFDVIFGAVEQEGLQLNILETLRGVMIEIFWNNIRRV